MQSATAYHNMQAGMNASPANNNSISQIQNLFAVAGQTLIVLEKQIGAYSEYESEENLWQSFIETVSDEWVSAREDLDKAVEHLNHFKTPQGRPLGLIGEIMESEHLNAAEAAHERALSSFNKIDKQMRECEVTREKYESLSLAAYQKSCRHKTYIQEIRNALGLLEGSLDISKLADEAPENFEFDFDLVSDTHIPSEAEIAEITFGLYELTRLLPEDDFFLQEKEDDLSTRAAGFLRRCFG